jgi:hypothetical protein
VVSSSSFQKVETPSRWPAATTHRPVI